MVPGFLRSAGAWVRPAWDALFAPKLPWEYRWRLFFGLQPISLLAYSLASYRYLFRRPFQVEWLPIAPGRTVRVLVYKSASPTGSEARLRPLHVDCHAGAFVGGIPEANAAFCSRVARETGAVVISTTYRFAPRHPFPAAIDDVDAVVAFLQEHARERYGADPSLMTTSGSSAGGNLALATSLSVPGAIKAAVTFYAAINLQLKPQEKPRPPRLAGVKDPLSVLLPLYDSYAGPVRAQEMGNPRMSPYIARLHDLPENILMIIPGLDILVHEQMTFIQRLKEEATADGGDASDISAAGARRFEYMYDDDAFHGYHECRSISFLRL